MSQSAVSADFDNDGYIDIYVANAYPSFNQPNILYQNQGDGTFIKVEVAGGAASYEVGPHRLDFEIGQRLAVADYDNDGFVDIVAGSTTAKSPRGKPIWVRLLSYSTMKKGLMAIPINGYKLIYKVCNRTVTRSVREFW